jgi:hypothetical protein
LLKSSITELVCANVALVGTMHGRMQMEFREAETQEYTS